MSSHALHAHAGAHTLQDSATSVPVMLHFPYHETHSTSLAASPPEGAKKPQRTQLTQLQKEVLEASYTRECRQGQSSLFAQGELLFCVCLQVRVRHELRLLYSHFTSEPQKLSLALVQAMQSPCVFGVYFWSDVHGPTWLH